MNPSILFNTKNPPVFIVENEAFEGVKRIAQKVAKDFEKVCEKTDSVKIVSEKDFAQRRKDAENAEGNKEEIFIFATLGMSGITDRLIKEGKFDSREIIGKNEVYQIKFIENPFDGVDRALFVCGSDKRGTIYGMFALSEYIGVSPLHFWGDVEPILRENIEIKSDIETVSKEPGVKYRGFFINDEWPCFGNWTFSHYGGFTSQAYDHVFELLLRLKGNYIWPAMWTSSFALDGPGNANEELADIYGVVVGASHHEPCLRASEEWDKVRGPDSEYGNEWNYYTNKKGLLKYWEDGLKRSGKYEKIVTIGMRGERDSSMLGDNAALRDNIELLKDIIANQRELVKKYSDAKNPELLALYKEVEAYFYGNEEVEGLKDWDGLDNVICMLCEDNFGFMRTLPKAPLPTASMGKRRYGMYYHFDYHGGPVSYEWMPSTSFERTWEQMCMAYDYGIRYVWIVNVGDLKFNEVSLAYFLELAYDFEEWGTNSPNSIGKYTEMWLEKTFPSVSANIRAKMADVLHGYIRINSMRRPEALNAGIYHPCHYLETDRMLDQAANIEKINEEVYSALSKNEKDAWYSMIYFPAKASINLLRMHLYSAKNMHFARQGKKIANKYAALVTQCMEEDRNLFKTFGEFKNGKWKGMELEEHIGFVVWNDDNCRNPLRVQVEPFHKPRMVVSRKDREEVYHKAYGGPMTIRIDDFLYEDNSEVIIEVANDGVGSLDYFIAAKEFPDWLEIICEGDAGSLKGTFEDQTEIILRCNRSKLTNDIQYARLLIKDGVSVVAVEIRAKAHDTKALPPMTFLENNGVITIEANHFCTKKDIQSPTNGQIGFKELKNYGRSGIATSGGAMKVFPVTANFNPSDDKPSLSYRFLIDESGEYTAEIWTTPANPVEIKHPLRFMLSNPKNGSQTVTAVDSDFNAGSPSDKKWCQGVLDNIRICKTEIILDKGVQEIIIEPLDANLILERILIYKKDFPPLPSYLGPLESGYSRPDHV
jgi:hypothetical protein